MSPPATAIIQGVELPLDALPCPLHLDRLLPSRHCAPCDGPRQWHVEIGFGKGRYLLSKALDHREDAFLGIEMVAHYARLLATRAARRGASNLAVLRGEALYLLAAYLPRGFADTLHIYFPDPWPKSKHHRRRLFAPASVDLVLDVLRPGGQLYFATDFLAYGEDVATLLGTTPRIASLRRHEGPWPEGARTNYEAKYATEGRPILRLVATLGEFELPPFHPQGRAGILAATAQDADRACSPR